MEAFAVLAGCLVVAGVIGAAVILTLNRSHHHRRRAALYRAGRCAGCGYDVHNSGHRCPECGADLFAQAMDYWRTQFPAEPPVPSPSAAPGR